MIAELIEALQKAERVVISTHTRPDGDAIGSQLALASFLRAKGKQVWMINSDPVPYNLEWLPGAEEIRIYDHSVALVEAMASADAVVIVDTNALSRLGTPGNQLKGTSGRRILIDHHTDPETWFDLVHRRESASSTGELLYELMAGWDLSAITPEAAISLYVAILTDTGSFRFAQVTPTLHRMTADLLERAGMNPSDIHARVYDRKSPEGMKLLVHRWAQHFGGGGHRNAAGAFVKARLQETIQQAFETAPRYLAVEAPDEETALSDEDAAYLAMLGGGA
jgi:phosphoesterase RecJ-like protein